MTTNIILKKSSITGRIPGDSALAYGELALNYTDGKLFYKHSSQSIRNFLDENQIISLIDSDYVTARAPTSGQGSGTDSAQVIGIIEDTIDSDYIVARLGTVGSPLVVFNYEADSGQSEFTGADVNGNALSYQAEDLLVFVNGILLIDSDDYTATNGSSISLFVPADSGDLVTIAAFNIRLSAGFDSADVVAFIDSDYIAARSAPGTDSATVISIIDSDYINSRVTVSGGGGGIDSAAVISIIDSDYINSRVTAAAGTDSSQVILLISDTVDSAYIQARQTDIFRDSAFVTGIIDLDYITAFNVPEVVFDVINNGASAYTFSGDGFPAAANNPVLYLQRGLRYRFNVNASGHPFQIRLSSGGSAYSDGVSNNGAQIGEIFFTVPMNAPNELYYQCMIHGAMGNTIYIFDQSSFISSSTVTDSSTVVSIISSTVDSAYIQARQVDIFRDSAFVTGIIDSDYISSRVTISGSGSVDSAVVVGIIADTIDSSYILSTMGVIGSPLVVFTYEADSGQTTFSGLDLNGQSLYYNDEDILVYLNGLLLKDSTDYTANNGTSIVLNLAADSGDVFTVASFNIRLSDALDSADVVAFIDSDYIAARSTAGTDSATVVSIITDTVDSDYISSRVTISGSSGGLDSAAVISLIDSDYISSRVTISGSSGGLDSAAVISLIDSDYISSRIGLVGSPLVVFTYEADSGQTAFSGADLSGRTLAYNNAEDLLVYLNGVLLVDSDDYYATDGSSVNLYSAADSGNTLTIAQFNIRLSTGLDSNEILTLIEANIDATVNEFKFVATNEQTTFTGADYNGNTLAYGISSVQVYMNGVRLVDSDDYTASNGSSIVLSSGATTGDQIVITSVKGAGAAIDLSAVDQDILPATDSAYDLGSPTKKFRSLYLSGNTLYLGSLQLKDSAGELSIVDSDGASVSVGGGYVSTYSLDGTLQVFNGSQRKYIHDAFTLATVDAYLVTGPVGSAVTIRINKNGISIGTITIADGTAKTENTVFGTSFIKGDYITVDITAVGSSTPGTDLYLNFIFS
jgi:hypothetical protein